MKFETIEEIDEWNNECRNIVMTEYGERGEEQ